jgi:hypothetical protein
VRFLRSAGFWSAVATVIVIGGIGWDRHSLDYWRGVCVTAFVMAFWLAGSMRSEQIHRHALERENEELRAELRKIGKAEAPKRDSEMQLTPE